MGKMRGIVRASIEFFNKVFVVEAAIAAFGEFKIPMKTTHSNLLSPMPFGK